MNGRRTLLLDAANSCRSQQVATFGGSEQQRRLPIAFSISSADASNVGAVRLGAWDGCLNVPCSRESVSNRFFARP